MKVRRPILIALALLALPMAARAQETSLFAQPGRIGLGLGATDLATGVSGKFFLTHRVALQGIVGFWYGYGRDAGLNIGLDAIVEMPKLWSNDVASLNWNAGGGATFALFGPGAWGGFQAIGGLGLQLRPVPLEFVLELRPTFLFGEPPGVDFFFGVGAAIRFFFA
jgi:hypothetical protein